MAFLLDLGVLAIIALSIFISIKHGAVRTIVSFVGSVASSVIALLGAKSIAPVIYSSFIKEPLMQNISSSISNNISDGTAQTVSAVQGTLPSFVNTALAAVGYTSDDLGQVVTNSANSGADAVATNAADSIEIIISPIIISLVTLVVSFVLFAGLMILVRLIARSLNRCCNAPVLRQANGVLGGVLGFLKGAVAAVLICFVLSLVLPMTMTDYQAFKSDIIDNTLLFNKLYGLNLFDIPFISEYAVFS